MPNNVSNAFESSLATLFAGFVWALARVSTALAFISIPGLRSGPDIPRVFLIVAVTLAMFPRWGRPGIETLGLPSLLLGLVWECAVGVLIGVIVALAIEAYQFAAQMIGLQAGLSYASTIDPTNETDSGVLLILMQLLTALLFLSSGLDTHLFKAMAASFETFPPGGVVFGGASAAAPAMPKDWMEAGVNAVIRMSSQVLVVGLRLAMPVIVFLLLLDVALALIGRIEQQFQLSGVLFPAKLAGAFLAVAGVLNAVPWLVERSIEDVQQVLEALPGG